MKQLYFIRHGETDSNVNKLMSGLYNYQLTPRGLKQAHLAGNHARKSGIKFDLIICSPLDRTTTTAQIIADEIGYDTKNIVINDLLLERNFGILDGKSLEQETGITLQHYFSNPKSIDHISGVEKLSEVHKRAQQIINMAKNIPETTVLIVSHGAVARSLYRVTNNLTFDAPIEEIENAKIIKLI